MINKLKAHLKAGKVGVNAWSLLPSSFAAEFLVQGGWDSITFDLQHGLHDYASAVACIQACQSYPATPMVRVPWSEPGILGKVLDAGTWGVIVPMINTAEDAKALVKACYYPPLGMRSNGPVRAAAYGVQSSYQSIANGEVLILPQIETREAVENLEAILDVEGVSGVYVGPSDLAFSYGLSPAMDREEPEILSLYGRILAETAKRGQVAAIHTLAAAYAVRMAEMGFQLITVATDAGLVAKGARDTVTEVRRSLVTQR
ncbi:MAG: aldolase/citrate lyase family protein [Caulobacteraceae bacterium]